MSNEASMAGAPPIVDAHHHLQDLSRHVYPWLNPEVQPPDVFGKNFGKLRVDYLIEDYLSDISGLNVVKSIHIENGRAPGDAVAETMWLQSIADRYGFPHGIVAHVPLQLPRAQEMLEGHKEASNLRGVRQILNWDPNPTLRFVSEAELLTNETWRRGFALLRRFDLSFDLQIYPRQMADACALAYAFPDTQIILDHLGMPIARTPEDMAYWEREMRKLAQAENVVVKLSGVALGQGSWRVETMRSVVLKTIDIFGARRCMFASNFPVDRLYSTYRQLVAAFQAVTAGLSLTERKALFSANAERIYRV